MKLLKLELNNFLSYKEEEIALDKIDGVSFLVGRIEDDNAKSNGAGKSAIWDAVDWCLFCNSRVTDDNGLIRLGADEMMVGLEYELDKKRYSVRRIKKRGKSQTLAFYNITDDMALSGNSVKETQKKIVDELGMDEELFGNTVFARQGKIDEFPRQLPSKRKDMLRNILKLTDYEVWERESKEMAKTFETQYISQRTITDRLSKELSEINVTDVDVNRRELLLEQVRVKVKQIEDDIAVNVKEYEQLRASKQLLDKEQENVTNLEGDMIRVKKQIEYIDTHEKEEIDKLLKEQEEDKLLADEGEKIANVIKEITDKIDAEETAMRKHESIKQQMGMLETEMTRGLALSREAEGEVNKIRAKYNSFKDMDNKCPFCDSDLTDEKKQKVEKDIIEEGQNKKTYRDKLQNDYEGTKAKVNGLKVELKAIDSGIGKAKELDRDKERFNTKLINAKVAKNKLVYAEAKLNDTKNSFIRQRLELKFELERKIADHGRAGKMIEGYKLQLADIDRLEKQKAEYDEEKQKHTTDEREQSNELSRLKYILESKKKKEIDFNTNKMKMEKDKKDLFVYAELTSAFGKDGIPLLVIENALAELQSEVQKQLEILTDGRVLVEFRTQKELKSGKTSDTLDILVSDRDGTRDFNLYSGGERMRIALAIRLGLSRLLSRRAGKKFDILIIDEISDLDLHGMTKFVELINLIANDYKQIFVVSHIDELKDRFSQVIQVIKSSDGSRVYM